MSHRFVASALALVAALVGPSPLFLASCDGDDPTADATGEDAGEDARRRTPSPGEEEETADAGADVVVPPIVLPSCVGDSIPLDVTGVRAFVRVAMDGEPDGGYATRGDFVVDYGTTRSTIDLVHGFADAGAPSPTICGADAGGGALGIWCEFRGFEFFGDWDVVTLTTADHSVLAGLRRQAGILGTDFLALNPFTLDFQAGRIHRSAPTAFCTDAQLLAAGLRPLPSQGFFATNLSELRPLSEVITSPDASTAGFTVPNVPTVPVTIAGEPALAQLDTGYEDRIVRSSINVNEPLLERLLQQEKVTRAATLDLFATTCVPGLNERLVGYVVVDGQTLDFVAEGGSVARRDRIEAVYLKSRSDATFPCGGISTWTVPAAQIGASFFIDARALVIDPASSRVWIPKN